MTNSLIKVYMSLYSNIWAFCHDNPFLSVSYLHCFLFVCFYFRPLNKKSKVRCLKLFLFFSLKQGCWYAFLFISRMGERREWKEQRVGDRILQWDHFGVILWGLWLIYCGILCHFKYTASAVSYEKHLFHTPLFAPWSTCIFPLVFHLRVFWDDLWNALLLCSLHHLY